MPGEGARLVKPFGHVRSEERAGRGREKRSASREELFGESKRLARGREESGVTCCAAEEEGVAVVHLAPDGSGSPVRCPHRRDRAGR